MPRTVIPSYRLPVDLLNLGVTNLWDFRTGFDGTNSATVQDMVGDRSINFTGSSPLSSVYTANSYFADLEAANADYFNQKDRFVGSAITAFTISCWVLPETLTGQMALMSVLNGLNNQRTFSFQKSNANRAMRIIMSVNGSGTTGIYTTDSTTVIADGQLAFLAATYDGAGATMKIYLNGVESSGTVTSGVISTNMFLSTTGMCIGATFDSAGAVQDNFDGKIGMCTFANGKVMNASEMLTLYKITGNLGRFI